MKATHIEALKRQAQHIASKRHRVLGEPVCWCGKCHCPRCQKERGLKPKPKEATP